VAPLTKVRQTGWDAKRLHMVENQLVKRGIKDERVLAAMGEIPRHLFVQGRARDRCYSDEPVGIGYGQTLSQPYMTAIMVQCLELQGQEKVLEVGGGCGYHAAVLGTLASRVISVEIVPELAAQARANLKECGCGANVTVVCADGSRGWPAEAPYEAISVAAAAPAVPEALLAQLADGGRLVIPVGGRKEQALELIRRQGDRFTTRIITHCRFVPLVGEHGWEDE
jgi:protein-L-isoaspartate(D-aspartate) O-methyltransferase